MFDPVLLSKLKKLGIFVVVYTVIFVAFFSTISYTLPFVLAFLVAFLSRPLTNFFKKKLRFSSGFASLFSTILSFSLVILLVTLLVMKIASESRDILSSLPSIDINAITAYAMSKLESFKHFYEGLDPSIIKEIQGQITSVATMFIDVLGTILNKLVHVALSLPLITMIVVVTLLATFFISKDLPSIEGKFLNMFSQSGQSKFKRIWAETTRMLFQYIKSYGILIFVTFLLTWIGFALLGVEYSFMLALLAGILDILPVVGIIVVYLPLAVYYWVIGNHGVALILVALYAGVTVVRNILEPKLVSSSLDLHPVAVLAAMFIGLQAYGLLGVIYLIFLMIFYNILKRVNIM